jgi:hypothetical protein
MTLSRLAVLVASSAVLGCATPSGTPIAVTAPAPGEVKPRDFTATGEVFFVSTDGTGHSAAFSDFRVVGPQVNMSRDDKGQWGGNVAGKNVILTVEPGRLTGDGVNLFVVRKGTTVSIQGMFGVRQVWFTLKPNEIQGTTDSGRCSFDMNLQSPGVFRGETGCAPAVAVTTLQLTGQAANVENPTMPQFVLAMLAVLPY